MFSTIWRRRWAMNAPIHAFLEFFQPVLSILFFPSHWLVSNRTIVKTMDSSDGGMNPVTMTIINPWKEYWPSRGLNQQPLVSSPHCYRLSYGALSNPVAMTISNPQKRILAKPRIEPATSCSQVSINNLNLNKYKILLFGKDFRDCP